MARHYLANLFEPHSIAIIGATPEGTTIGGRILNNLLSWGYEGAVFAVNPKHTRIDNTSCYKSVLDIPNPIDLVIIATPASAVPKLLTECGNKGISHAIIISAGFGETGKEGSALEKHIYHIAKGYHMHILGPHCLGVIRSRIKMNATFDKNYLQPGHLAFVSQSGALAAAILDWAFHKKIGFSTLISLGNSVDIDFGDVLDYLTEDEDTAGILMSVEGIHDARRFMSSLRAAARIKPVVILKAGRSTNSVRAALAQTGFKMGDETVFNAALARTGALRVQTIEELFIAAEILTSPRRTKGNKIFILTNAGGPGVMAADRACDLNLQLPELLPETKNALKSLLPAHCTLQNPLDILGDAAAERFYHTLAICMQDKNIDGILTILSPISITDPIQIAETLIPSVRAYQKPFLACWMGDQRVKPAKDLFANERIPFFDTPEKAIQAFSFLTTYQQNQQLLLQTPEPYIAQDQPEMTKARAIINNALKNKIFSLSKEEALHFLSVFQINSSDFAPAMLANKNNRELCIQVFQDSVFGPVISLAAGGLFADLLEQKALALPPLNPFIVKQMIAQSGLLKILNSFQGLSAVNFTLLIKILLSLSEIVCENPEIKTITINPLLINDENVAVGDVLIDLHADEIKYKRYRHMAIHPYPYDLVIPYDTQREYAIRPVRPEDALMTQEFVRNLSSQSKYFRFMQHIRELTPESLVRLTQIDYDREMTFLATHHAENHEKCIGVAHYITRKDKDSCEFAIAVADDWQNKGIGSKLMKALCSEAKIKGLSRMIGSVLATNTAMLEMIRHLGFEVLSGEDPTIKKVVKMIY